MSITVGQAEELIKKAQKCLKTSFLKWSSDIDSAIEYYGKAAIIYRNMGMLKESADIYLQIADLHSKNGAFFHCAKAFETASLLLRNVGDYAKVVECIKTAGQILRQNGVPDSASILYTKGAKALEENMPEDSAKFYEFAADTLELEEKYLQASDCAGQSARMWMRLRRFKEVERLLRNQMRLSCLGASGDSIKTAYQVCGKAVTALVVLNIVQEDSVAAGKVYSEAIEQYHFGETDDAAAVARLLQVYESYDAAAASEVVTLPTFRNLETEFARLVRSIKFPDPALVEDPATTLAIDEGSEDIC